MSQPSDPNDSAASVSWRKSASDLEWPQLLDAVGQRCLSSVAADRVRAWRPADDRDEASARMTLTAEALAALERGDHIPRQDVCDIDATLARSRRGGELSGEALRDVGRVLAVAAELRAWIATIHDLPALTARLGSEPNRPLADLAATLARSIGGDGEVLDAASPALAAARKTARDARAALQSQLERETSRLGDALRDGSFVERDGRYGLPVRADARGGVPGIVIGTSASGATLYVEPPAVTAVTNRLRMAEADAEREAARVRKALSERVAALVDDVAWAYEAALTADQLGALCRYATEVRGVAIAPQASGSVWLEAARHPLLCLREGGAVASDVGVEAGQALIVSGPNAGGKTVALKCVGLAVLASRTGIPVPAGPGSRIGWFGRVLTGIGDEQSIAQSLSTFSAEVVALARILGESDGETLVLLDEIAGGTDPDEGAALAAAVLEALVTRGAAVMVTTHYERLKELAGGDTRFANASVGFDFEAMAPTFSLTLGVPGASAALAVAARFGLPPDVVERAQALIPDAVAERQALLDAIERERRELARLREQIDADVSAAEALRREAEAEREVARAKERRRLEREAASLTAEVKAARQRLREAAEDLPQAGLGDRRARERAVDAAAHVIAAGGALDRAVRDTPAGAPATDAVAVGDQVFVERLGKIAEVVEAPERGEVKVRAGAFTLRVRLDELRLPDAAPAPAASAKPTRKRRKQKASRHDRAAQPSHDAPAAGRAAPLRVDSNTVDLRGMRVDEALGELDRFIDSLLRGDGAGYVLHGHGTGALRNAVREHLALSGRVAEHRAAVTGEGGDAFTIVWV